MESGHRVAAGKAAPHMQESVGAKRDPGGKETELQAECPCLQFRGTTSFREVIRPYPGISSWTHNYMYRNFLKS